MLFGYQPPYIVMDLFSYDPPSSFYFKVVITHVATTSLIGITADTSFQDVSGISTELGIEEIEEGGENRFTHKLPTRVKNSNLVVKRGIAPIKSPLVIWCMSVIEGDRSHPIVTAPILVYLMNEYKIPIRGWFFDNAYPVKWSVDNFNSTKNEVALETVEFSYTLLRKIL